MSLTKRFRCDDGGIYYVREVGDQVFWFGESMRAPRTLGSERDAVDFANVFIGRREGDEVSGEWFDVPKGGARSSGRIRLRISADDSRLDVSDVSGGFGGRVWRGDAAARGMRASSVFHNPGFQSDTASDLTGTWMGDDGGAYYVRHVGNRIIWFGERGNRWSNVFVGTLEGGLLRGDWADVPKGGTASSGSLTLELPNHYTLRRSSASGGFGGSSWNRVHCKGLDVRLDRLIIHDKEDELDGDEPYLWTVYFKIDGDRVSISDLRHASATVVSSSRSHGNLTSANNVREGSVLPIPSNVGRFGTVVKTIRGLDPLSNVARDSTQCGFIVIAWEEDGLSDGAVEAGRRAFVNTLQQELDRAIRRLQQPDMEELEATLREATEAAIRAEGIDFFHFLFNDGADDKIGQQVTRRTFGQLASLRRQPLNVRFREGADYELQGSLTGV